MAHIWLSVTYYNNIELYCLRHIYLIETMAPSVEKNDESIDCEEIIIHPRDYEVSVRKKLMDFLKKLGITYKTKGSKKGMSREDLDRLLSIEMACGHKCCSPCTYPNCQRFVREQLVIKKAATY